MEDFADKVGEETLWKTVCGKFTSGNGAQYMDQRDAESIRNIHDCLQNVLTLVVEGNGANNLV